MRRALLSLALLGVSVAGCRPALDDGEFLCEQDQPGNCPSGWICQCRGAGCDWRCYAEAGSYCGDETMEGDEQCDGTDVDPTACSAIGGFPICTTSCTVFCTVCGNQQIELTPAGTGEQCDDGNVTAGDGCSPDCRLERCGDTVLDEGAEICDDGNNDAGDGCSPDCLSDETCGNGYVDVIDGELCDDGNLTPGDGCQPSCTLPTCGDGIVDDGEICDDGDHVDGDGCNATCSSNETCGNGVVDGPAGESCDDGNTTSGDGCNADCLVERCGNGVVEGLEVCDDGNTASGDECSADCLSNETCGNSYVDSPVGEQCDDGNFTDGDGCQADCRLPRCGDLIVDPGEVCDDGNGLAGDGCTPDCDSNETCGNGYVDLARGEACDAGAANSDLADAACRTNCQPRRCGDAVVDTGESCDDGNLFAGDGCNSTCTSNEACGNGVRDPWEACDDGDTESLDGCSANCLSDETCGNGYVDFARGEECDNGALNSDAPGAACRTDCLPRRCGDLIVDPAEMCDDGDTASGDGCNATCTSTEVCGNGFIDPGEACDDHNVVGLDGCSADCQSNETCGNGYVDVSRGEACDQGAANSSAPDAPCRPDCQPRRCGDSIIDSTETCDLGAANSNAPDAACRTNCQPRRCGDAVLDPLAGEVCDDGNASATDSCTPDCLSNGTCGNGYIDAAKGEQCDDGNLTSGDTCQATCQIPRCGDGIVDATLLHEGCDAGAANSDAPDAACRTSCQPRRCGDAIRDPGAGEVCDDGNLLAADGCTPDCLSAEMCGNAYVDFLTGELCDDGDSQSHDGCSSDCALEEARWVEQSQGTPAARRHAAAAFDTGRSRTVLFGGVTSTGYVGDTWEWDGTGWAQRSPATAPTGRSQHALAYDARRGRTVLFGGDNGSRLGDTWEWDGVNWIQLTPAAAPPARNQHAMAYDARRGKVVLFGGYAGSHMNDTWEWDGVTWTQRSPATSPAARLGHSMVYDAGAGKVLLFGGGIYSGGWTYSNQTWEWDGTNWTLRTPATSPPGRSGFAMAFDARRNVVTLSAGYYHDGTAHYLADTWEWDRTTWTQRAPSTVPPARSETVMVHDTPRGRAVMFGGWDGTTMRNDTYEWNGANWYARAPATAPTARWGQGLAYDAARRRVVMFGGRDAANNNETWEWLGSAWLRRYPAASPAARRGQAMAYDAVRRRVVMFGGFTTTRVNETYTWSGSTWSLMAPAVSPGARDYAAMAFDAARGTVVLFGGNGADGSLADTWEWNGTTWTQRAPATSPAPRHQHAMAYDSARGRVVLFGGRADDSWLNDTWEWNGTNWTQVATLAAPSARDGMSMAYDAAHRRMVLHGGHLAAGFDYIYDDTWEYDGATWTQVSVTLAPSVRYLSAMTYDEASAAVLMFGGNDLSGTNLADTWLYHRATGRPGDTCAYGFDLDGDDLVGCADDDCWGFCSPLCSPDVTTCSSLWPSCGDGACSNETCRFCPEDCGTCTTVCGDFVCEGAETTTTCPGDCSSWAGGVCQPAQELTCGHSIGGTTFGGETNIATYVCSVAFSDTGPEGAFRFQRPTTGPVTVNLTGLSANLDLIVLGVDVNGACGPTTACVTYSRLAGLASESATFTATAGVTYYLMVDGYLGASSAFTISATCP